MAYEHEYRRFPLKLPGGVTVTPPSYVIYPEGSLIKARNGQTGAIDYSGTDASTVIQAAIDGLPEISGVGRGEVFIKHGKYDLLDTVSLKSRMTLRGEGRGSYLINKTGDVGLRLPGTSGDNHYDTLIEDFTIEGVAGSSHGILVEYGTNIWLHKLYVTLHRGSGVKLDSCGFSSVALCSIEENSVEGLYLLNSSEIRVINNGIKNNSWNGIFAAGGHTHTVIGNQISRNTRSGLNWQDVRSIILGNSIFSNNSGDSTSYHGIILVSADDNIIALNKFRDNGSNGYAVNISNMQSQRNLLCGNIITGTHKIPPVQDLGRETVYWKNPGYVSQVERMLSVKF